MYRYNIQVHYLINSGAPMPRYSGRKPFTQEIFSRHVAEMRSLLHALELRDSFEDNETRPKMDMYETCHDVVIEFDLPGFSLDAITLKMNGLTLVLEACKPREQNEGKFICVERSHGHFHHAVTIPGNIDPGAIRAEYRKGVLRVICPKSSDWLVPIIEL
jgi:HSP20 family protein